MVDVVNCGREQGGADFDFLKGVLQARRVEEDVRGLHHIRRVHVVVIRIRLVIFPLQSRKEPQQHALLHFQHILQ